MTSQYQLGSSLQAVFLGREMRVDPDRFEIGTDFIVQDGRPAIAGENIRPRGSIMQVYVEGNDVSDANHAVYIGPEGVVLHPGGLYYLLASQPVGKSIERFDSRALNRNAIHFYFYEIVDGQLWVAVSVPYAMRLPSHLPLGHVQLEDDFGD